MITQSRVRRHGYNLMSLASLGAFGCVFGWLLILASGWQKLGRHPGGTESMSEWWAIAGLASITMVVQLWALRRLRHIGKLLHTQPFISSEMALAWRQFAKALVVAAFAMLFNLETGVGNKIGHISFGLNFGGLYFMWIACLCSYSIAWLLQDAVALKEEAEGFV